MIVIEKIVINDRDFIRQYSDKKLKIKQIGTDVLYDEAIDPIEFEREYVETDISIEEEEDTTL